MKFEVTNWPEYEAGLRRRGSLTLWMTAEALSQWQAPKRTTRGDRPRYSDLAIDTALTLGLVFGLRLRQAEGLLTRIRLDTMRTNQPAAPVKGKGLVFVRPTLVAEVNFGAWTHDGNLRHPSFKGIREVADHVEVCELG